MNRLALNSNLQTYLQKKQCSFTNIKINQLPKFQLLLKITMNRLALTLIYKHIYKKIILQ